MAALVVKWSRPVNGIIRLTRYQDFISFVVVTTLLGILVSGARLNGLLMLKLLQVLAANCLAVGFAFMFNDVEDAADDALNPAKANRNPISAGLVSIPMAYAASFGVAILAAGSYFSLGPLPFWLGMGCLVLGGLYSWLKVRLKSIPVVDLISHGLMLAGLQLWCAYFAFAPEANANWVGPFVFVVAISMYGELFNEVRDLEHDRLAGVNHTAALVGERIARWIMYILLGVAGISFGAVILTGMIPVWVAGVTLAVGMILLARPLLKIKSKQGNERTGSFHQPALLLGMVVLGIWVVGNLLGF